MKNGWKREEEKLGQCRKGQRRRTFQRERCPTMSNAVEISSKTGIKPQPVDLITKR